MNQGSKQLAHYIPIAKMIAKTFGKNCEVVIHDLSRPQNSVIFTVNSHVTGRQLGQSFEHLITDVLLSDHFDDDYTANYATMTPDGRKIKSSTVLIRDDKNKVVGALCINYDIDVLCNMQLLLDDLMNTKQHDQPANVQPFDHVIEIVDDLIDTIIGTHKPQQLKRKDKIELIAFMEQKGLFLVKGAIEKVAEKLNISKVTVYSYLDDIKKIKSDH